MAIGKANASATGNGGFDLMVGVGSFRVLGVNPTKEELEKFYGREMQNDPVYLSDKTDAEGKPYKQIRLSFMIQADPVDETVKKTAKNPERYANWALIEPFKTTINFFVDSRYFYTNDKNKVQVIDKYGRTAWVTVKQAENKQVPVYANGPAKIDKDYHPCRMGEEEIVQFIINYLNITPIESYNRNTGQWVEAAHKDDCEIDYHIDKWLKGDISELTDMCQLIPTNQLKVAIGVRTDNEGRQFNTAYTRVTLRNGSQSYKTIKDKTEGSKAAGGLSDTVFTDDPAGVIPNIHIYKDTVKETDLSKPIADDPFASTSDDLPFGDSSNDDPFAGVA